jgi:hypothetical protein
MEPWDSIEVRFEALCQAGYPEDVADAIAQHEAAYFNPHTPDRQERKNLMDELRARAIQLLQP